MRLSFKGLTPISPTPHEKTSLVRHTLSLLYSFVSYIETLTLTYAVRKSMFMCMILTVNENTGGANVYAIFCEKPVV